MNIRLRLTIVLAIASIVPLVVMGVWSLFTLQRASELATQRSQEAMEALGEEMIYLTARSVAAQVKLYLDTHPEVDLSDYAQLEANQELAVIAVQPVGQEGYTALFDANAITHFHADPSRVGMDMSTLAEDLPEFWAIFEASLAGMPAKGYYDWQEPDGRVRRKYMSIVPVKGTPLRLASTTYIDEFSQPVSQIGRDLAALQEASRTQLSVALVVVLVLAIVAAFVLGRLFSRPIREMAAAATRITAGDLSPVQIGQRSDEFGILAGALNAMMTQSRDLLAGLEERNQILARRMEHLQAVAEVARAVTATQAMGELLNRIVILVRARFDLYHAGLYLVDSGGEYAELRAASDEAGQQLPAQERRLAVGGASAVGYATAGGQIQVAETGSSLLPEARSEAALPLRAGGRVIGVLDVQSREAAAFDEEYLVLLQVLADQLAVAIENARLLGQMQQTVRELEAAYGRYTREAWQAIAPESEQPQGYRYRQQAVEPIVGQPDQVRQAVREGQPIISTAMPEAGDEEQAAGDVLAMPIRLRDQVVGAFNLRFEGEAVTPETLSLIEEVSSRLSLALESASLQQDSQRRAAREQLIGEVTARVRESLDIHTVLETAANELYEQLGLEKVTIHLSAEDAARHDRDGVLT